MIKNQIFSFRVLGILFFSFSYGKMINVFEMIMEQNTFLIPAEVLINSRPIQTFTQ